MEATDALIVELYRAATGEQLGSFRDLALTAFLRVSGARAAAWWSRGVRGGDGEFSRTPETAVDFQHMRELASAGLAPGLQRLPRSSAADREEYLFHYPHLDSRLISTFWLSFTAGSVDEMKIERGCPHLVEAGAIALGYYIRRDDWLFALGRPSRGTAALVDGSGTIYVASERFYELLGTAGEHPDALPFALPVSVVEEIDNGFVSGPLHFRVSRVGQLYLLHARKPLPLDSLSPREQEIARALGSGKTFKSVARQYGIAVSTVANHASRIYRKLAIYRREDLVTLIRAPDGNNAERKGSGRS